MLVIVTRACTKLIARRRPETHKRGVLIADGSADATALRAPRKDRARSLLTLAGVAIPPSDEAKHFKLIGTTGTGKSTAIRELLGCAIARGDRAVFADPDAAYLARFLRIAIEATSCSIHSNRDSVKWDLFAEVDSSLRCRSAGERTDSKLR